MSRSSIKVSDNLVQKDEEQSDYLVRQLFNVNIRLFNINQSYRKIIIDICNYMEKVLKQDYSDYNKLSGISGANVGIPYNIIIALIDEKPVIMINPTITRVSKKKISLQSNCGSLKLPASFPVERREWLEVSFYDIDGKHKIEKFYAISGGATIQHEIDHNRGVLITDTKKHI